MNSHSIPSLPPTAAPPESQHQPRLSASLHDAGDRVCCGLLLAAVAVAIVLGASWLWDMPSFR